MTRPILAPVCPGCGAKPVLPGVIPLFCPNIGGCTVLCWDPYDDPARFKATAVPLDLADMVRQQRLAEAAAAEAAATEKFLWWMSFADTDIPDGPGGPGFLGVCIVEAAAPIGAMIVAHRRGCNPGGEIGILGPLPLDTWPPEWWHRLLSQADVESMPEGKDPGG